MHNAPKTKNRLELRNLGTFDRFHTAVAHDKLDLGTFDLEQGAQRLSVEIAGAHEKAIKRYLFGLDYLLLIPAP